ncbi:tetratricopeptide repeat protein [bacterium]|nr:tetratricopeptide repeat protein [bacterium]
MGKRFQLGPEIERYTQLLARDPDSLAFVPLADAYRKSGLFEEAFAVLKRGVGRRPEYLPAKIVLGKCYLDLGNYPKAEATFEEILEIDRDNLVALSSMANVRLHQRRYGEAATVYRSILELDPSNASAAQQLAKLEGKTLSRSSDEVIEIDIESPVAQIPTTDTLSDEVEEKTPDTIDFEDVMRGEKPPVVREEDQAPPAESAESAPVESQVEARPGSIDTKGVGEGEDRDVGDADSREIVTGQTNRDTGSPTAGAQGVANAVEPTEPELDVIPDTLDIVVEKPEKPAETTDGRSAVPMDELIGGDGVPPVKHTDEEPEIDVEVPVPPPPDTDELEVVEPEVVVVMPEDEIPPEIPPVKDAVSMLPTDEIEKPAFKTFSSWLSGLVGKKGKEGREGNKDEESSGE